MAAKLIVAVVAIGVAAYTIRSLSATPQVAQRIIAALIAIGLGAYAIAFLVSDGSC